jgi:hypothetical protein
MTPSGVIFFGFWDVNKISKRHIWKLRPDYVTSRTDKYSFPRLFSTRIQHVTKTGIGATLNYNGSLLKLFSQ